MALEAMLKFAQAPHKTNVEFLFRCGNFFNEKICPSTSQDIGNFKAEVCPSTSQDHSEIPFKFGNNARVGGEGQEGLD